jgi:glucose-1-phosphate thymidylyltransferase
MKGIILAGGTGSRLYPLTKVTNKHLLRVGHEPMIYYPIKKLIQAGISDILIVTGVEHMGDVVGLLGSGKEFNCQFTYKVQDEAGGIAQALMLAKNFTQGQPYTNGAHILLKEVPDPERFGVATIADNTIIDIQEKPAQPKSNMAVTGVYMYDSDVFNIIESCSPSARGELEISDVNAAYLRMGNISYGILNGWWSDAGTFASITKASDLVLKHPINNDLL